MIESAPKRERERGSVQERKEGLTVLIDQLERLIDQYKEFYRQIGDDEAFPKEELQGWCEYLELQREWILSHSDVEFAANEAKIRLELKRLDYDIRTYYNDTGEQGPRPQG